MIASLLMIAAIAAPAAPASPGFRAVGGATARATVSVRIVSGVSFGKGRPVIAPGATHRITSIIDANGREHRANLLEFQ